jgi:23S rRNA (uracil1939-C5)-methyltransferase
VERFEKRYGYARLKELIKASTDRREAPCPHQGYQAPLCGGCPWMIGNYESQLHHKEHRLKHALTRAGLLSSDDVLKPVWGSPNEFEYRNRAQLKTNGEVLGFVSAGSHSIAPLRDCMVMSKSLRGYFMSLKARLPRAEWKPGPGYDWNFLDIDESLAETGEMPIVNRRRPFRQGNSAQNERMRTWLGEKLRDVATDASVLELFCGSGNFTEVIAARGFRRVLAVEVAEGALVELQAKKLNAVDTRALDLSHPSNFNRLAKWIPDARVLVLDPPREGAKGVGNFLREAKGIEAVCSISCDIATFTRDAADMMRSGLKLVEVQPLDMFPQTPHLEVLAYFTKSP